MGVVVWVYSWVYYAAPGSPLLGAAPGGAFIHPQSQYTLDSPGPKLSGPGASRFPAGLLSMYWGGGRGGLEPHPSIIMITLAGFPATFKG
jgi:hypothetical protein